MRKIYHTEEQKREAQRAYDHKRQQTEHRRAYDRERRNTDESRTKRRERAAIKREAHLLEKQQRLPTPDKVEQMTLFKVCPRCNPPTEKFLTEFAFDKNRRDDHAGWCKECNHTWANSEEEKARQRNIKREMRLDPVKGQAMRDRLNRWREKHPESQQELTMRRNARKKAVTTEYVRYDAILERDGFWCYICSSSILPDQAIDFDHVIPLSRGGYHCESNIKPTHRLCNRRKADKLLEELTTFDRRGI